MSRRRRAALLLGLALVLGGLAASDVSRREARLREELGPLVPVVVARAELAAGDELSGPDLVQRRVPARFAPAGAFAAAAEITGLRAAVAIPAGAYVVEGQVGDPAGGAGGPGLRAGERIADVLAAGAPDAVTPGARVDVLVTREGTDGGQGSTRLALEDVEVLGAGPAPEENGSGPTQTPGPRVTASLRVTLRQAVYLAAAQSFAREIRLLPRAAGDRARGAQGLSIDSGLG
ncbi:MAG: Flp pilus assembly protein CpaB [Solirubrobacteraceae bacterium]